MSKPTFPTVDQRIAMRERPPGRPVMQQCWDHLLFLHWRFPAVEIQAGLPKGLYVDEWDGSAWVGIVPFFMRGVRLRWLPPIPTATNFLELNLRTYVFDDAGVPGVWFFSLDASSWLAVHGARWWFGLPYWHAAMSATIDEGTSAIDYVSHRRSAPERTTSRFTYRPAGPSRIAEPGSLEFFLIERYVLFSTTRRSRLRTGRVHHPPYQFSDARVEQWDTELIGLNGLTQPARPPEHAVVSPGVCVDVFGLEPAVSRSDH